MKICVPQTITPDLLTASDAVLTASNVAENDHAQYNGSTTYALGDRIIYLATGEHRIYESLQASNTGNTPPTSPTWWLDVSATNRWKMFDGVTSNKTTNSSSIEITLAPTDTINCLVLFNVLADTVTITVTDNSESPAVQIYNQIYDMIDNRARTNWYNYFFEPIVERNVLVVLDIPSNAGITIDVDIDNGTDTAECGQLVIGRAVFLGKTQWNSNISLIDYSVKDIDSFGNAYLLQRKSTKRAEFDLVINQPASYAFNLLEEYRAVPLAWIGDDSSTYDITVLFGFYRDLNVLLSMPEHLLMSVEVEGL